MKDRDRYFKVVEWSEEDQCYIGRCPGLMFGGVHGDSEAEVLKELSQVADEWIATVKQAGKALPPATAGKEYSGKFVLRVGEDLHRALTVRALQTGQSLNTYSKNMLLNLFRGVPTDSCAPSSRRAYGDRPTRSKSPKKKRKVSKRQ